MLEVRFWLAIIMEMRQRSCLALALLVVPALALFHGQQGMQMTETVWNTPEEAMSIMGGQLSIIRALAVELHKLGKLDDELLRAVEGASIKAIKGTSFNAEAQDALQIRLMDFSINAAQTAIAYLKANRDNGNLST